MCNSCFTEESISIKTAEEYNAFDLVLINKTIHFKTLELLKFVKTGEVQIDFRDYEDLGYNVYRCLNCRRIWGFRTEFKSDQISFFPLTEAQILKEEISSRIGSNWKLIALIAIITGLIILAFKLA